MPITSSSLEKALIREEARRIRARRILEVGVFKGQTTAVLSEVAREFGGYVVAIDPMKWASKPSHIWEWIDGMLHPFTYEPTFWKNIHKAQNGHAGPPNVHLQRKLSTDADLLSDQDEKLLEFDLAFIDGEHSYEAAMRDF